MDEVKKNQTGGVAPTNSNENKMDDIVKLKTELESCKKERDEFKEGWQRERAAFENFQKNLENLFKEQKLTAEKNILLGIFDVVDSFNFALSLITHDKKNDPFVNGIYQIKARLDDFLKKNNVAQFGKEGETFDPSLHEAITIEKVLKKEQDGKIIKIAGFGFKLRNIIIRPAKVVIGQYHGENSKEQNPTIKQ